MFLTRVVTLLFAIFTTSMAPAQNQYGIAYGGGPVLQFANVYLVWYGNWSGSTAPTLVPQLFSSLTGSQYYNILSTYWENVGNPVNAIVPVADYVSLRNQVFDNYSQGQGTLLTTNQIKNILSNPALPVDPNGVYIVLTASDVDYRYNGGESCGHDNQFTICGYHSALTLSNTEINYAVVGNPNACPAACVAGANGANPNTTVSPNGDVAADALASWIMHELAEAVTDPDCVENQAICHGWFNLGGQPEIADLCQTNYGQLSSAPNGSKYNVMLGGKMYLLQALWANVPPSGGCATSYTAPPATPTINAVTDSSYQSTIFTTSTIVIWGTNFTSMGGNKLQFQRSGFSDVWMSENDGHYFWDYTTGQINAGLNGRLASGTWAVTVWNASGLFSSSFTVQVN